MSFARRCEIVVIGAGLIGIATAFELRRRGHDVLVLEAEADVAMGASYANGGLLTPSMSDPWNAPGVFGHLLSSLFDPEAALRLHPAAVPGLMAWGLRFLANATETRFSNAAKACFRLARYSADETLKLTEEQTLVYDHARSGALKIFRTAGAMASALRVSRMLGAAGLRFEPLDRQGVLAKEPHLAPIGDEIAGALWFPDDAVGDARGFCLALSERFGALGGVLQCATPVVAIEHRRGATHVVTRLATIACDAVVLAAGAESNRLLRAFGAAVPLAPAKGYSLTVDASALASRPERIVVDEERHIAIAPIGTRLRAVGTAEFAGFDRTLDERRIAGLRRFFAETYPDLAAGLDLGRASAWTGLRPISADGLPYIGETGVPRVWLNAGHGHLGWTLATGSACLLADLYEGRAPALDPTPYRPQR
jgi:D-amino-acid dehydrogenase